MKTITLIIPLCFLLTGCPGGPPSADARATFIEGDHICFSIDKKDSVNYYTIDSSKGPDITTIVSSGHNKLNMSYPDSCIKVKWEYGYTYVISYGLNGKSYEHEFFIDNDGQLTNLGGL
ncbi:putative T6SS immunity periplasmic lipoprotein [Enterobacter oligotrophicus]|uniref:putative T6SS immunity periplasmic lipoprotein n=1 Tax=Enterobacter oligotrophicus TaxID=2478464 RepID=UPI00126106B9|nr:putative T6SS immunity periplasmic lipoprotein [Enterobacter oligotrophicus]